MNIADARDLKISYAVQGTGVLRVQGLLACSFAAEIKPRDIATVSGAISCFLDALRAFFVPHTLLTICKHLQSHLEISLHAALPGPDGGVYHGKSQQA